MTETATKTIRLKNGDEITVYSLTRGRRLEAMENLKRQGIYPSATDLNFLNGMKMEQELGAVCFAGWKRAGVDGASPEEVGARERRLAVQENGAILNAVVTTATELNAELRTAYEVEEKNS
jgi:hypothetical protein